MGLISTLLFSVAASVLGNILTKMFESRKSSYPHSEVVKEVQYELVSKTGKTEKETESYLPEIMDEIELLANRHPHMQYNDDIIHVNWDTKPFDRLLHRSHNPSRYLSPRLRELDKVIATRKVELCDRKNMRELKDSDSYAVDMGFSQSHKSTNETISSTKVDCNHKYLADLDERIERRRNAR